MKIIIVDRLNYPFGGTQKYVFSLSQLLQQNHNQVYLYDGQTISTDFNQNKYNFNSPQIGLLQKIESIYSISIFLKSLLIFTKIKPDIIHLNNINYLITPSIIHAAKLLKIPIIAHLHDYKIICAKSTLLNNFHQQCHGCQNQNYFSIFKNKCTRHNNPNFFESLFLYLENTVHNKILHIYKNIDCFIAPSNFLKETFVKMGFPYPIEVINNFTSFHSKSLSKPSPEKNKILYFGRISQEKGLINLCKSIENLPIQLTIVGTGPLQKKIKQFALKQKNIKILPFQSEKKLIKIISQNDFTVTPSTWPENASISIIESLSLGKPVIGSNIGGIPEMIQNTKTGWLFSLDNSKSLRLIFQKILTISDKKYLQMSHQCQTKYQNKYSPNVHYQLIIKLYKKILICYNPLQP